MSNYLTFFMPASNSKDLGLDRYSTNCLKKMAKVSIGKPFKCYKGEDIGKIVGYELIDNGIIFTVEVDEGKIESVFSENIKKSVGFGVDYESFGSSEENTKGNQSGERNLRWFF